MVARVGVSRSLTVPLPLGSDWLVCSFLLQKGRHRASVLLLFFFANRFSDIINFYLVLPSFLPISTLSLV